MHIDIKFNDERDYKIYLEALQNITLDTKVLIVTNPKVGGLHLPKLLSKLQAKEVYIVTVDDGEPYKNFASVERILNACFNHKLNRSSTLIALGGGVIGDMTGFCAGIYQRGIDFIQIPTTLLSMVDASVGGKTGVNNAYGKNLVGVFHQPRAVHIDTAFLETLPEREFGAGVAEIIKMAVAFDATFFEFLESNDLHHTDNLTEAIKRSVELKAKVVTEDEREKGQRALLNYGHTFAHVIENLTDYSEFLHGEAVAIGISMANKLALECGFIDKDTDQRIDALLQKYALPTTFKITNQGDFYEKFFLDKKSLDSKLKFILPTPLGNAQIFDDISKESILGTLKAYA